MVFAGVCLFFCTISKKDAARITKLNIEMADDESWKPVCFGIRGQGDESREHCRHGCMH